MVNVNYFLIKWRGDGLLPCQQDYVFLFVCRLVGENALNWIGWAYLVITKVCQLPFTALILLPRLPKYSVYISFTVYLILHIVFELVSVASLPLHCGVLERDPRVQGILTYCVPPKIKWTNKQKPLEWSERKKCLLMFLQIHD